MQTTKTITFFYSLNHISNNVTPKPPNIRIALLAEITPVQ